MFVVAIINLALRVEVVFPLHCPKIGCSVLSMQIAAAVANQSNESGDGSFQSSEMPATPLEQRLHSVVDTVSAMGKRASTASQRGVRGWRGGLFLCPKCCIQRQWLA